MFVRTRYGLWPKIFGDVQTRVPVYIETGRYDATTLANIRRAIDQVNADLNGCVGFFEVYTTAPGLDFLWISDTFNSGTRALHCNGIPGRSLEQAGRGQKAMITTGGGGAGICGASQRGIMSALVTSLGLLPEYRRQDRSITVTEANVDAAYTGQGYYTTLQAAQIDTMATPFDFNSITMVERNTHAASGQVVFSTTPTDQVIGNLTRLSLGDCNAIRTKYTCPTFFQCSNPYTSGTVDPGGPIEPPGPVNEFRSQHYQHLQK
ncbi:uncharacterized protein LOC129600123 [Paramacrobiotus metropolitanus]|uniref:uncharacterized protein LOC129600123 n=1 Tax=Paramacrobiotus metropolitanus TaxID=2943436 RepID=UPI002445CD35|nr:uncharacterized protein LOC129600123 [Paramacrobiotus metropolitanus]